MVCAHMSYSSHMQGICLEYDIHPRALWTCTGYVLASWHPPQVDKQCLRPKFQVTLAKHWQELPIDSDGHTVELLPPPLAAALLFHPKNWKDMHKRATGLHMRRSGERVYQHPFSCDEALRCQAEVDAKPLEPGVTPLLVGVNVGDDKTETERMESEHPLHLKLLNTGKEQWLKRHSKILLAVLSKYRKDEDDSALDVTRGRMLLYQRDLALVFVLLEVCAKKGIKMTHRSLPPQHHRPACIFQEYALHMQGICPSCSEHGTFRVWPLLWLWSMDRDGAKDVTGTHRYYKGQYVPRVGIWRGGHSRRHIACGNMGSELPVTDSGNTPSQENLFLVPG